MLTRVQGLLARRGCELLLDVGVAKLVLGQHSGGKAKVLARFPVVSIGQQPFRDLEEVRNGVHDSEQSRVCSLLHTCR